MTRNYIRVALIVLIVLFLLSEIVFGEAGILANRDREEYIASMQHLYDQKMITLETLQNKLSHMYEPSSLLDYLRNLGYAQPQDEVYLLDSTSNEGAYALEVVDEQQLANHLFVGISKRFSLIIASSGTLFILAIVYVITKRPFKKREQKHEFYDYE
ncbi:MAG: hypothetical protein ACOX0W_07335 [Sphaerochaetaceae bacterium]|jgi:hypothetical protein